MFKGLIKRLTEQLTDSDQDKRINAASELRQIRDPRVVEPLI